MENNRRWLWLIPALTAVLSLLLFWCLYRYDNKYTYRGSQPIQGVLILSEEELEQNPVHFLIYDWEFYPNELLEPKDFKAGSGARYRRYLSIGQYSGMELGRLSRSPHGSGTYRLTLELPETDRSYAIEIPEVYSAYRFYLNDDLRLQMGDPDPEHYQPGLQKRVVSFYGSGRVQLLLAVSDYSHFYSGMVYPPAIGKNEVIQSMRGIRVLLHGIILSLAALTMFVSAHLFVRSRNRTNFLFALLAVCLMGYTCYPSILLSFFTVGLQPWYSIQIFCYYMMIPLVILIFQWLLEDRRRQINGIAAVLFALGLVETVASVWIGQADHFWMMELYSMIGEGTKWLSAGILLALSVLLFCRQIRFSVSLFSGTVCYACALIADRLFPLYEPVLGGWFMEIGGMILLVILNLILWSRLTEAFRFQMTYSEHESQMQHALSMQREHYERLADRIQETRRLRHDMRQHMRILYQYAEQGNLNQIRDYLKEYAADTEMLRGPLQLSENPSADAVLHYYQGRAKAAGVKLNITGNLPDLPGISGVDVSVLLGNLLENALDAQKTVPEELREIRCQMQLVNDKLTILIQNPYRGTIREKADCFYSTKHAGLGVGTSSARMVAEKYGGYVAFSYTGELFTAMIFLTDQGNSPLQV